MICADDETHIHDHDAPDTKVGTDNTSITGECKSRYCNRNRSPMLSRTVPAATAINPTLSRRRHRPLRPTQPVGITTSASASSRKATNLSVHSKRAENTEASPALATTTRSPPLDVFARPYSHVAFSPAALQPVVSGRARPPSFSASVVRVVCS